MEISIRGGGGSQGWYNFPFIKILIKIVSRSSYGMEISIFFYFFYFDGLPELCGPAHVEIVDGAPQTGQYGGCVEGSVSHHVELLA